MPPGVTVGERRCSITDVGLGEEGVGSTVVVEGVPAGVEVGAPVAVKDGATVGTLVDVGVGVLVGTEGEVAVGAAVPVEVLVAVGVGLGSGPNTLSPLESRTSNQ